MEENLEIDKKVLIKVVKEADLKKVFGSLKRGMSGQQFKDMVREGWKNKIFSLILQ